LRDRESETPGKGDAGAIQYGSGQYLARAASMCCCTRPDGVDLLRRFDAVAFAGQAHVHEDHRGLLAPRQCHRLVGAARDTADLIAELLDDDLEVFGDEELVLDDQYAWCRRHGSHPIDFRISTRRIARAAAQAAPAV
jgi:hypothetical protein